jgi:IS5 family transposase
MRNKSNTRKVASKRNRYKITNWSSYNQALKQRGSLEIWMDEGVKASWYYQGKAQRGAQYQYSDSCIELACIVRELYRLAYRQTEGFLESLVSRLNWKVQVPDYTIINRRRKSLDIKIGGGGKEKKYIVMDSTGVKVYGEGEWKVRQHGWSKHRTWMKIHLAVDEGTGLIESCVTTTNSIDDAAMVKPLLNEISGEVTILAADGAYDKKKVYNELESRKIKAVIPPRKGARIEKHGNRHGKEKMRDKNIRAIRKLGRKQWKKKTGYHRRSLAETTMYRFKNTFGDKLTSRVQIQQIIEVKIKCMVLNKMAKLGMPVTIKLKNAA